MTDQEQINQVSKIYEAFGKGDVFFIMSCLDPEVEWEFRAKGSYGIPWLRPGRGLKTVTEFFEALGKELEIQKFDILGINKVGPYVVDLVDIQATVRSTGKMLSDLEVHVWKLNDQGKVTHFRHVVDTIHHQDTVRK